ncbi:hypothetical protein [Kitasatospora sp. MBT66]|uniref:wHTH domain-containing protein n=1 Tax=Kitasatospora sp. MBT66 TaxID=1444769 RepID=UPI0011EA6227|nr:hypothetical protein [Kitasatospora sp. MBT66]
MSRYLDSEGPWLEAGEAVSAWHVLTAANQLRERPGDIVARLEQLGHSLADDVRLPEFVSSRDLLLLRGPNDDDHEPELTVVGETVPMGHVLWCATELECPPAVVREMLALLGHLLPSGASVPERVLSDDLLMLSAELDWRAPWLPVDEPVPLGHILRVAARLGRPPVEVAAQLVGFGHRLPEGVVLPAEVHPDDLWVLSKRLDGQPPWLEPGRPAGIWHVLAAAQEVGEPPEETAERLAELGHPLPPGMVAAHGAEYFDLVEIDTGPSPDRPLTLADVLRMAGSRHSPADTARRLQDLGFTLAGDVVYE